MKHFRFGKTENQHFISIISIALGILMVYGFVFYAPVKGESKRLSSAVKELKEKGKAAEAHHQSFQTLDDKRDHLQQVLADIYNSLVPVDELVNLVDRLSQSADSADLKLTKIRPLSRKALELDEVLNNKVALSDLPVALDGYGGYHELGEFLNKLETGPQRIAIRQLRIAQNPTSRKKHTFSLIVVACVKKEL